MRVWMLFVVVGWAWAGLAGPGVALADVAGYPQLSEVDRAQLATAVDGERPDEPALYPLLLNMRQWTDQDVAGWWAGLDASSVGPYGGWGRVLADPEGFRGQLVALQGRFAGRVREVKLLRGGPWGRTVTEWGVVTDGPKDAGGRVAVVYFPGEVQRPRDRQRVRVVGRFFKRWTDVDAAGVEVTFPVFVGALHWEPVGGAGAGAVPWRAMVVGVGVLAGVLWWVRRWLKQSEKRNVKRDHEDRGSMAGDAGDAGAYEDDLPEDPAQALGVLRDRGQGADDVVAERE